MLKEKSCGCITINEGKVLLIKSKKGHWDFPKGHMEKGETEKETALREVKEETNLDVNIISERQYINHYITDTEIDKTVVYFIAKKIRGEEKPQEGETVKVKWFEFDKALETLTFDNAKEILRNVLKDENYK